MRYFVPFIGAVSPITLPLQSTTMHSPLAGFIGISAIVQGAVTVVLPRRLRLLHHGFPFGFRPLRVVPTPMPLLTSCSVPGRVLPTFPPRSDDQTGTHIASGPSHPLNIWASAHTDAPWAPLTSSACHGGGRGSPCLCLNMITWRAPLFTQTLIRTNVKVTPDGQPHELTTVHWQKKLKCAWNAEESGSSQTVLSLL